MQLKNVKFTSNKNVDSELKVREQFSFSKTWFSCQENPRLF